MPASRTTLAEQVDRYVELGVHELAGLSEDAFRAQAAETIVGAVPVEDASAVAGAGRLPWLLVVTGIDPTLLMPLVEVRGKPGYVDMDPSTPNRFATIEGVDIPATSMYLLQDFDPGDELRNHPPSAAMTSIRAAGRQPLTITEGVCAVVLHPELARNKHAFSLLASRSTDTPVAKSVPALWISRGAPRLGWCWNENPHTWLGSASCLARG
ncbi:MAG: hypothetical protein JWM90_206 [Thermoleophilia bacterium]|nr:hypothetical protein [Thermoleophilia bacterium]